MLESGLVSRCRLSTILFVESNVTRSSSAAYSPGTRAGKVMSERASATSSVSHHRCRQRPGPVPGPADPIAGAAVALRGAVPCAGSTRARAWEWGRSGRTRRSSSWSPNSHQRGPGSFERPGRPDDGEPAAFPASVCGDLSTPQSSWRWVTGSPLPPSRPHRPEEEVGRAAAVYDAQRRPGADYFRPTSPRRGRTRKRRPSISSGRAVHPLVTRRRRPPRSLVSSRSGWRCLGFAASVHPGRGCAADRIHEVGALALHPDPGTAVRPVVPPWMCSPTPRVGHRLQAEGGSTRPGHERGGDDQRRAGTTVTVCSRTPAMQPSTLERGHLAGTRDALAPVPRPAPRPRRLFVAGTGDVGGISSCRNRGPDDNRLGPWPARRGSDRGSPQPRQYGQDAHPGPNIP